MSYMSALDQEYERLGLARPGAVMRMLKVDKQGLDWLVKIGDVTSEQVDWKAHRYQGFRLEQFAGRALCYQNGRLRLAGLSA